MDPSPLLLELGGVILVLSILARAARRIGLSPIPLYLGAGLALGEGGIFPLVTAEEFIGAGSEIGVILLLLMLGLEYSPEELLRTVRVSAAAGVIDLLLNFAPGLAAGILLGWSPEAALFLGGVTYISSSGVVAKVIHDAGWLGNRETPIVLSILVIEDLVMAIYLPVAAVLLVGAGILSGAWSIASAVGAVVFILWLAMEHGERLSGFVFSRSDEVVLLSIFGGTLLVAGIADRLNISAAVGAFLVGIGLSGPAADRARALLTPLRDLFGAVFFFFFGLSVDPGTIFSVAPEAALLGAVTLLTKIFTGWLSAARRAIGPRGRLRAGALLIARGEFSLVIAGLGVGAGLEPRLGPLAAAYVVIMVVAGTVTARTIDHLAVAWQRLSLEFRG